MPFYNNIPVSIPKSSSDATLNFINKYYTVPVELNSSSATAMQGFFESKGFGSEAAESVSLIILAQSKKDDVNPFKILDTLKGLSNVELSAIVGEILNYNRFKTSSLGISKNNAPNDLIQRNIVT